MTIDTKQTLQPALLHREADQLVTKIEQALCDPAATRDAFFLHVDHLAHVLKIMHQQTSHSTEVSLA